MLKRLLCLGLMLSVAQTSLIAALPYPLPDAGRHDIREGRFHIFVPSRWSESKDKIMVMSLHGSGEDGGYIWNWDPFAETANILVICPAAQLNKIWSSKDVDPLLNLTQEIKQHYGAKSVLLSGASAGGHMALMLGLLHPDQFDGIQTFMGLLNTGFRVGYQRLEDQDPNPLTRKLPVLMIHGWQDPYTSVASAKETYQWLKDEGFNVQLFVRPGMRHEHYIPDNGFILEWFRGALPPPSL